MKKLLLGSVVLGLALGGSLRAGEHGHSHGADGHSHEETGVFEPPHGGAFARLSDHWIEFYLEGGQAVLCMYEPDGKLTEDQHAPKKIQVKVSGKGMRATTFKAEASQVGCASWAFSTKAKLLRVEVQALVDGKLAKAKLNLENKAKPALKGK